MTFATRAASVAMCLGLVAGAAHAASEEIQFTGNSSPVGFDSSITLSYNGQSVTTPAGPLQYVTSTGNTFLSYCVELTAEASRSFQTYTETTFSSSIAQLLGGLFSATSLLSNKVDTVEEYAAMALAVWEITSDTSGSLSVSASSGNFYVSSTDTQSKQEIALANSYLQAAKNWSGASLYTVTKLTNATYQDQVKVTPVPEATTWAMMGLGLAGIAAVSRRRRQG